MTQQFARVPADAGDVVRQVRGFGGVPWSRLFRYLRPQLAALLASRSSAC